MLNKTENHFSSRTSICTQGSESHCFVNRRESLKSKLPTLASVGKSMQCCMRAYGRKKACNSAGRRLLNLQYLCKAAGQG
jgi:hypothetical protein